MAITVLMVAEKPSIAGTLASALSHGKSSSRKGVSPAVFVHEFNGQFQGQSAYIKITSCAGHVYSTDFPSKYQSWDKVDPLTLFDAEVIKDESNPKTRLPAHFKAEAKGCTHLVLWLDCDREGENICFEVIRNVKPSLPNPNNIWRAKFSSLAPGDLVKAYNNLGYPNENESLSVDARQEMDLKIGVAFTRFQTRYFQGKYGDLDSNLISYGPCQTPTLWFCVKRHAEIQSFQPEAFYYLDVSVRIPTSGDTAHLEWERDRVFDQQVAQTFKEIVSEGRAVVGDISESEDRRVRPQALDTVSMLKAASSTLGIGPQHAMHIAERLYLNGFITYPRTETNNYPSSFDLRGTLQAQSSSPYWGGLVNEILREGMGKPRDGKDAGDHPPITPIRAANESDMEHDQWRIYELVTRHFIATLAGDCKFIKIRTTIDIAGESFYMTGRRLIHPGFTRAQRTGEMEDIEIPKLRRGDVLEITNIAVGNGKTSPPPYLSESDLLGLMEKHCIGTDASMATHINNICERNYVQLAEPGRRLVPTRLGITLVHGYQIIDPELVLPKVRGDIEGQCTLIAQGKAKMEEVLDHSLKLFKKKFIFFSNNIDRMDALFESTFTSLAQTGKAMSRCGNCKKYMNLIDKKPVRLFCRHCDQAYPLPTGGTVRLYKELTCPLDGFELVLISHPSGGKSYPVCPMCYNDPPFPDVHGKMNCRACPHATCKHGLGSVGVCACTQEDCNGTLCLDPESRPKWHMDCNTCNFQVKLFQDAHKVAVSSDQCDSCGSYLLEVVFHKDKSPLPGDSLEKTACVVCDEFFNSQVQGAFSRNARLGGGGGGRGKGKRRGKGGRRGGGGRKPTGDPRMTFDGF